MEYFRGSRYTIREQILDEGKISELSIAKVFRHDTGLFICQAKNNYGQDQMSIELVVQGGKQRMLKRNLDLESKEGMEIPKTWEKFFQLIILFSEIPETPKNIRIVEQASRSITLAWTQPYAGNSPIINYVIQSKLASG